MSSIFQFKKFSIDQSQTAMKIGTDAVLLGSWISVLNSTHTVLDIGAGTGILSLMLAQRSNAELIDAIEIDDKAFEQCVTNFEQSPWSDRLFCYHCSFKDFVEEMDEVYDLIISNPPFLESTSADDSRKLARDKTCLPLTELIEGVHSLIAEHGVFGIIIPYTSEEEVTSLCLQSGLFPNRITRVRGQYDAKIKRSLMEFSRDQKSIVIDELTIEIERHRYTPEYIKLTKDFYLKM